MESKKKPTPTYTAEFRERGVRLYREHRPDYTSDNAAYRAIASKLGCSHDTLRAWCLQAARDAGERAGLTTDERARLKELERENRELRTANEILKKGEPVKAPLVRAHWRTRILPRRSSTAIRRESRPLDAFPILLIANDRLHRRASRGFRGRADLSCFADRPGNLPSPCRHRAQSRACLGPRRAGRCGPREDQGGPSQEPGALRCPQGLAPASA